MARGRRRRPRRHNTLGAEEVQDTLGLRFEEKPAFLFGKQVPALVVYDEKTGRSLDVYPDHTGTKVVRIADYFKGLLADLSWRR